MTETTCLTDRRHPADADLPEIPHGGEPATRPDTLDDADGWQALALATRGEPLADAELAAAQLLPIEAALDLLFPDLDDAARHEALWALDTSA